MKANHAAVRDGFSGLLARCLSSPALPWRVIDSAVETAHQHGFAIHVAFHRRDDLGVARLRAKS